MLLKKIKYARGDLIDLTAAVYLRKQIALPEKLNEGERLLCVNAETMAHGLRLIIMPCDKLGSAIGTEMLLRGLRIIDAVRALAVGAYPAPCHSIDYLLIGNGDADRAVYIRELKKAFRLLDGPGKAVKKEAVHTVILLYAIFHHADYDIIGNEFTPVNERFRLHSEGSHRSDFSPQHISGGDMCERISFGYLCRLGAFTGTRRT